MPSIDERVVAMSFENAVFEAGVARTMATLGKLNQALAMVGAHSGLQNIETQGNKVTLQAPMSALDKLRTRLFGVGTETKGFDNIEQASHRVSLLNPLTALDKLRQKLGGLTTGTKGFTDIETASHQVTLSGMSSAIDGVSQKFGALKITAVAALATVASQATSRGLQVAKSLTLGPVTQGLDEYATNLNSIQTILANTKASGAGLKDVNAALQELNLYSDQTIYNFSEMAKNIGTFTAAGVDLKTATGSIKGIANLAALSGSNSMQASTAMYQLSQAIAAGRVSLQDWNSVVNAGMGGTVFQRALAKTAVAMGTLDGNAVSLTGKMKNVAINGESFRESITARPGEKSWLTSDVLTSTLNQFTGDLSDAELKAQGFNDAEIKAIQAQAKTAKNAATEVKTLKGVFDVAKESMGSGWAATFQLIFGDFTEAKSLFTGISQALQGFIGDNAAARNKVLANWKKLGGREDLLAGLKNAFVAFQRVLGSFRDAFRDIFPRKTGKDLADFTESFRKFTAGLKPSATTLENLRRTLRGFFAVVSIGWYVVKNLVGVIFDLLGIAGKGRGKFLNFTGTIGDFFTALQKTVVEGDALRGFFKGLTKILGAPLKLLRSIADAFLGLFSGADSDKAEKAGDSMAGVTAKMRPMQKVLHSIQEAWHDFVGYLNHVAERVAPLLDTIAEPFRDIGNAIADAFKDADYSKATAALQTAFVGGIFLTIRKALKGGATVTIAKLDGLNKVFGALTGNLTALQKNVQANTLFQISSAIFLLATGVGILSRIDPGKLSTALTAVAVGMAELIGAMAVLSKAVKGPAIVVMPLIASGMVALAFALVILAGAMKIFATMSWEDLAKGLAGVGATLTVISVGIKGMGPMVLAAGPGLIAVAFAMTILSGALKVFASMSWEEIGKGMATLAGAMGILSTTMTIMGPEALAAGPGLIAAAFALTILAGAFKVFATMSWEDIGKAMTVLGSSLLILATGLTLMLATLPGSASLIVASIALVALGGALKILGSMGWESIIKSLVALGGALLVLAVGLTLMIIALPGAAALVVVAAGLTLLVPILAAMGKLSWGTIFKGLASIALTLGVLAVVGVLAAPGLIALGIALTFLAVPVLAVGWGMLQMAKAFQIMGKEGTKGVTAMVLAFTAFMALLPKIIIDFLKGLVEVLAALGELAPSIVESLVTIIKQLVVGIVEVAPDLGKALVALILAGVKVLNETGGPVIDAGLRFLLHFLSGLAEHIGLMTTYGALIVTRFLLALANKAPALVGAGALLIIRVANAMSQHMGPVLAAGAQLVLKFLAGVAAHITDITIAAGKVVGKFIEGLGGALGHIGASGFRAVIRFLDGVTDALPDVRRGAVKLAGKFLREAAKALVGLVGVGFQAIIDFLNGLAWVIRNKHKELYDAGANLAKAVMEGFWYGISRFGGSVFKKVAPFFGGLPGIARVALKAKSPSRVFIDIGRDVMLGMGIGISKHGSVVSRAMEMATDNIIENTKTTMGKVADHLSGMTDVDPVITPILDLSNVEREAGRLSDLTDTTPIKAELSSDQAAAISQSQGASADAAATPNITPQAPVLHFEQNNTSPKALSEVEIFRQTKNGLSQAKRMLEAV